MPARHAFACVFATAMLAVTAAFLHPLLGLGPLDGQERLQTQAGPTKLSSTGHSSASAAPSR